MMLVSADLGMVTVVGATVLSLQVNLHDDQMLVKAYKLYGVKLYGFDLGLESLLLRTSSLSRLGCLHDCSECRLVHG